MRSLLLTLGMVAPLVVMSSCGGGSGGKGNDGGGTGGAGGNGGGSGGAGDGASYAQVKSILSGHNCGFCHAGGGTILPALMNLDTDPAAALVGVDSIECEGMGGRKRVNPGMPGASYLVDKLKGTNLCSGGRMPFEGSPLSASEISMVESWIAAGASTD